MEEGFSLISGKSSDSGLHIFLHPLVLLSISDHITRHAIRKQPGPIVGALLGEQKGRSISLEFAFECNTVTEPNGHIFLDHEWFLERLQQFRDVHKSPALDLVGWFTVTPATGPTPAQLPLHQQILEQYNEAAILLAFHASELENRTSAVGKLPITIYESVYEEESLNDGDRAMENDGQARQLALRFREIPYSMETGEAEMISVDSVATGGGNATAIDPQQPSKKPRATKTEEQPSDKEEAEGSALTREEEDLIANLTVRLGAVKTLESRLTLIRAYLQAIQSSTSNIPPSASSPLLSHPLLRSIYSLISHLTLINPQTSTMLSTESLSQANDVILVSLLAAMGESIQGIRELGKKYIVANTVRQASSKESQHGEARAENMGGSAMWQ